MRRKPVRRKLGGEDNYHLPPGPLRHHPPSHSTSRAPPVADSLVCAEGPVRCRRLSVRTALSCLCGPPLAYLSRPAQCCRSEQGLCALSPYPGPCRVRLARAAALRCWCSLSLSVYVLLCLAAALCPLPRARRRRPAVRSSCSVAPSAAAAAAAPCLGPPLACGLTTPGPARPGRQASGQASKTRQGAASDE